MEDLVVFRGNVHIYIFREEKGGKCQILRHMFSIIFS